MSVRTTNLKKYSYTLDSFTHIRLCKFDETSDSYVFLNYNNFEIIFIHPHQARSISITCLHQPAQLAIVSLSCVYL